MSKFRAFIVVLLMAVISFSCEKQKPLSTPHKKEIDNYINRIVKRHEIPGLALAIIKDGKVIYKSFLGNANIEKNEAVTENTLFRLHSLSKIFASTAIFQLVENGKLTLEDKVTQYVDGLPHTWKLVKIKHLLTHSSGLPDIKYYNDLGEKEAKNKVFKDDIKFKLGEQFDYNQTNYWLINRIIRKVTGEDFENYVLNNQFKPSINTALFSDKKIGVILNEITEYRPDGEGGLIIDNKWMVPPYMFGAGGLTITLDEFINWNQKLDKGSLVSEEIKAKMWAPFLFEKEFPFAHGWGLYPVNNRSSYGFTGGGIVGYRKFTEDDLTVILLTNGFKFPFSRDAVIDYVAGIVDQDLFSNKNLLKETLYDSFNGKANKKAINDFYSHKQSNPDVNFESVLNSLGYEFLRRDQHETALAIFKLNVEENPDSWNVHDSLGEGYEVSGDTLSAIHHYKKSVELNGENRHG
ncbi:serine hydrolase domain-containing protein, partial [Xanthovirga aplysinae]|uniref:serine hydrolase domain-containing protein n=1 Tax=Xanthovirga aplysinae TaxID=2529853 RepID=UPI001656D969